MYFRNAIAVPLVLAAMTLCGQVAQAQSRGAHGAAPPPGARVGARGFAGRGHGPSYGYGGWGYLPVPYYPEPYDQDNEYGNNPAYPPPEPPVVLTQPAPAPAPPIEPLLMENHGGQWVRVAHGQQLPLDQPTEAQQPGAAAAPASPPAAVLPAAMIVFRDGHSEEIQKYMIQGSTLYVAADYWSTGAWTRSIPISDVDVPATLKLNQARGSKFNFPAGPNEVMLRF